MRNVVLDNADTGGDLRTDQVHIYGAIGRQFASHEAVDHSKEEWVRGDAERSRRAIKGIVGKRLTYRTTDSKARETGAT